MVVRVLFGTPFSAFLFLPYSVSRGTQALNNHPGPARMACDALSPFLLCSLRPSGIEYQAVNHSILIHQEVFLLRQIKHPKNNDTIILFCPILSLKPRKTSCIPFNSLAPTTHHKVQRSEAPAPTPTARRTTPTPTCPDHHIIYQRHTTQRLIRSRLTLSSRQGGPRGTTIGYMLRIAAGGHQDLFSDVATSQTSRSTQLPLR